MSVSRLCISSKLQNRIGMHVDSRTIKLFTNLEKSKGSYLIDADNNKYLDVFNNIASLPLGYNHNALIEGLNNVETTTLLAQRAAMGVTPPMNVVNKVENLMNNMAPRGMDYIHLGCGCGSGANENAFKAAFLHHAKKTNCISEEELNETAMINASPGAPEWKVMSFTSGFHGRTMGCLSATRSKASHKVHIPAFKWPVASFPKLKYPLELYDIENKEIEAQSLQECQQILMQDDVVAMIVEPVQAEGGDNHASNDFFRELRKMCLQYEKTFIVDEVQTGVGATGKMWAHEHWELDTPPDIVTFAKKMQIAGYFCSKKYRPCQPFQIYNTWLGDPVRLTMANIIGDVIHDEGLLDRVTSVGYYLMNEMKNIPYLDNVRGMGTFIAFDCEDHQNIVSRLMDNGVLIGSCGQNTIRIRPNLIFSYEEANVLLDALLDL